MSEAPPGQKLGAANFPCPAWHVQRVATEDVEPTMVLSTFKIPVQVQVPSVRISEGKFKTKDVLQVDIIMHRLSPDKDAKAFGGKHLQINVALTRRDAQFEETIKALTKEATKAAAALKKKRKDTTDDGDVKKKWMKECKHLLT